MNYKLYWTDTTCSEDIPQLLDDNKDEVNTALANIYLLPVTVNVIKDVGDYFDFEVSHSFEAYSLNEAKSYIERFIAGCGRDIEVWSLMDDLGNRVLTEKDEEVSPAKTDDIYDINDLKTRHDRLGRTKELPVWVYILLTFLCAAAMSLFVALVVGLNNIH